MSCLAVCCRCSACCQERVADKYPHIEYKSPADATGAVEESKFYTMPLEQIFGAPHSQTQYDVHHPVTEDAVTDQPVSSSPGDGSQGHSSRKFRRVSVQTTYPSCEWSSAAALSTERSRSLPLHFRGLERRHSVSSQSSTSTLEHTVPPCPIIEQSDVLPEEVRTSSVLQYSVYYDIQRSILQIHLLRASKLLPLTSWLHKKSNVFVVMYLDPNKEEIYESRLVPSSTSPRFDQVFEVSGLTVEEARRQSLVFRIYEGSKRSQGNFIGSVVLPLGEADLFGVITTMKIDKSGDNLPGSTEGDLLLSLMYNPANQLLHGTVLKATNLQKQNVIGLADPYVKINLIHRGVRQAKWKTSVKRNTLTPVFNESFQFDTSQLDIDSVHVEAVVMDYDRFLRNDVVGSALVGKYVSGSKSGRSHWAEILSSPHVAISHWHSIQSNFSPQKKH